MAAALALALLASGCARKGGRTFVVVKVDLNYRQVAGDLTALKVTVEDPATQRTTTREYRGGGEPIDFPTSFGIELPTVVTGPVRIEVLGLDRGGTVLVRGLIASQKVTAGSTETVQVWLDCADRCSTDAGAPGRDARGDAQASDGMPACGNGMLDQGEVCDTGIARGKPGACPTTCDDGIACTIDTRIGSACTSECTHAEKKDFAAGDGCCPMNGTNARDPDCSATCDNGTIEPGETCDTRIPAGTPGACPTASDCVDNDPCTEDRLISAGTCAARCVHYPITGFISGDKCCPAGATHSTDADCPVVCGNGMLESGEVCDMGIAPGMPGACPTTCKGTACMAGALEGSGCQATCKYTPITQFVNNDGCCPVGGNRNVDSDCPAVCGNAVVEPGEACDRAIAAGKTGACPAPNGCPPDPSGCMPRTFQGSANDCSARCVGTPITTCKTQKDGCCPTGCNSNNDGDCSPSCGNKVVESKETCDTAIPDGQTGACPKSCDNGMMCTAANLLSGGTCNAHCEYAPITTFAPNDGCCPMGGNHNNDSDCPAVCGNGVVEAPKETCDRMIPAGMPGACPSNCSGPMECKRFTLAGDSSACTARCESDPITACASNDGCCPPGCNHNNDGDCPVVCGNGVVELGEACDKGITAGNPGACPATCDDAMACTADSTSGRVEDCTRTCTYAPITACAAGDRCCPTGCNAQTDSDCSPMCGNNVVEGGETCDPPSSCPTTCPDDGDPCTADKLAGNAMSCTAACAHTPITMCSGQSADRCCPTGCSNKNDVDCSNAM